MCGGCHLKEECGLGWVAGEVSGAAVQSAGEAPWSLLCELLVFPQPGPAYLRQPGRAVCEDHEFHIRLLPQCGYYLLRHGRSPFMPCLLPGSVCTGATSFSLAISVSGAHCMNSDRAAPLLSPSHPGPDAVSLLPRLV